MEASLAKTYIGSTPTGDGFKIFVEDVAELLPPTVIKQHLYDSLSHLAGQRLNEAILRTNLWRIAGNIKRLRNKPVPPWNNQPFAEWVPAAIVSARKRRNNSGRIGYLFGFQVLGGLACPLTITRFWSNRFCFYFAKSLGYAARRPHHRSTALPRGIFRHPRELVTMRLQILIEPRLCTSLEPGFEKVKVASGQKNWNREQIAFRDRFDLQHKCPFAFPNSRHCYLCHVGYKKCRAGCHADNYEPDYCAGCKREDAPFDPELPVDVCVECYESREVQRQE